MIRIAQGIDGLGQPLFEVAQQSDTINAYSLTAGTAIYDTVPAGANFVRIARTAGADLFILLGATSGLAAPSGNITNGSAPEANPEFLALHGAATVGVVATANCTVTLSYFQ